MVDRNGKDMLTDAALESLFSEARDADRSGWGDQAGGAADEAGLGLPLGLTARILGDADRLLDERAAEAQRLREAARAGAAARNAHAGLVPAGAGLGGEMLLGGGLGGFGMGGGFWAQLSRALGGGPALAGLGAVAIAGLWLGVMPPAALETSLDGIFGTTVSSNPYLVDSATAYDFLQSEG
ncbi:hypothetical protein [Oceanicola sp. S124]|uniref:hypothetical protein n=1 Tax=Oceanicola sp. S124 TaxID=1042378 RepID=UPI000255972F|nr:hypothetical protein [Oceanicola sp. S124]